MFTKSTIALAIVFGITSGGLAAPKQYNGNASWGVYDSRGKLIGAVPDPRIRIDLQRDHGPTE